MRVLSGAASESHAQWGPSSLTPVPEAHIGRLQTFADMTRKRVVEQLAKDVALVVAATRAAIAVHMLAGLASGFNTRARRTTEELYSFGQQSDVSRCWLDLNKTLLYSLVWQQEHHLQA